MYQTNSLQRRKTVSGLANIVRLSNEKLSKNGIVAEMNNNHSVSPLGTFYLCLDNSAGGSAKKYVIGDPFGFVAARLDGESLSNPDSGSISPAAIKNSLGSCPVAVGAINYNVAQSGTQFSQPFRFVCADIDGTGSEKNISVSAARRNNAMNDKLITLEFPKPYFLGANTAFVITVAAGEKVTLDLVPTGSLGRV